MAGVNLEQKKLYVIGICGFLRRFYVSSLAHTHRVSAQEKLSFPGRSPCVYAPTDSIRWFNRAILVRYGRVLLHTAQDKNDPHDQGKESDQPHGRANHPDGVKEQDQG